MLLNSLGSDSVVAVHGKNTEEFIEMSHIIAAFVGKVLLKSQT